MAKKNFSSSVDAAVGHAAAVTTRHGLQLSDPIQEPLRKLKANPLNTAYFREESDEYFSRLRMDIAKRGIIVPLVAKMDGTLLAGHNRLKLAQEIGLKTVPVQYIIEDRKKPFTQEQEREFLIKDNVLRRQLMLGEWIALYKILYPDFEEQVLAARDGRPTGGENRLTPEKIAKETGQKSATVQKQLQKFRKEIRQQSNDSITTTPSVNGETVDVKLLSDLRKTFDRFHAASEATRKKYVRELQTFLKKEAQV